MFQPVKNPDVYILSPEQMIPVVQVVNWSGPSHSYNSEDLWKLTFSTFQGVGSIPEILPHITCDKYIEKYLSHLTEREGQSLEDEFLQKPENYICPDTDTILLSG